jgi:hypothetical protein
MKTIYTIEEIQEFVDSCSNFIVDEFFGTDKELAQSVIDDLVAFYRTPEETELEKAIELLELHGYKVSK